MRVPGSEMGNGAAEMGDGGSPKAMLSTSNPKLVVLRITSS